MIDAGQLNGASELAELDSASVLANLQAWARELGFSQIGVAGVDLATAEPGLLAWLDNGWHGSMDYMAAHGLKRARPAELVPGTVSVITARMDYLPRRAPDGWQAVEWRRLGEPERANVSLYARGRDYHKVMRGRLQKLADRLAASVGPFGHRVFTDSAPLLEVELASRSGIGWRGKHTLVLDREGGSMFFLGEICVDLALPPSEPVEPRCGSCRACIDVCPTGAIVAPYRLDARQCLSYLTIEHDGAIPEEFRVALGNRIYGCDDCQLVCPWNKFASRSVLPDFDPRDDVADATLLELWAWSEDEFLRRTEGSAIRRIGHQRWQRNLAVALGNALRALPAGEPAVDAITAALLARRETAGELVREHIDWALAQRGTYDSQASVASASGMLTMPRPVDTVTSPATKAPSPPIRAAST
ncbi:tRNA epoxyqueuosine(34) reductase QueG [Piscinibacter koreensis]|uniref:Epoxyqueuosine reductase n=1 Tax=Piscinibacter koreensis TaxID=2742824 RepID=A0A7Y6NMR0_9BURK|nr:tRNA epoxyqueuosine(34) reductase QueG [Schlegelella koreensis]NUZ05994.1 tRNA epoxyqueuosine(34) reductase QueG [Schlegelella koreensis]